MGTRKIINLFLIVFSCCAAHGGCRIGGSPNGAPIELSVFAGAALEPVMKETAGIFESRENVKIDLHFSGSGTMLSQMKMSRRADVYVPGSSDFMEKAVKDKVVDPATVRGIAYLVPAIVVKKGNPKGIHGLSDLARPGLRVAIGDPETVCVGLYAYEIFRKAGLLEEVGKNIVTLAESCSRIAAMIPLGTADAVIGWSMFESRTPDEVEAVLLEPGQVPRIAYIAGAVSTYTKVPAKARMLVEFMGGDEAKAIFKKHGYITTIEEARKLAPGAQVGGEYVLPKDYAQPVKP
jgi:molybdate transport system substrate-binding protein